MKPFRRVRMDWIADEVRHTVQPEFMGSDTIFHYSIPVLDETGDGRLEPTAELGSSKTVLAGGEVLISKLNPRKARVLIAEGHDVPTICSGEFVVLHPRGAEPRYLCWLLLSEATRQRLDSHVQSVTRSQQRARPDDISKMWIDVPPREFQRAIADYLDAETARIDAVVDVRRRMGALLEERWARELEVAIGGEWARALILDGRDVALPDGWEVRKLVDLLDPAVPLVYGILLAGPYVEDGIPYVGAGHVQPERLTLERLPRTSPAIAAAYPRSRMRVGELVYAIRGSFGAVEQIPPDLDGANLSRDAARIAPRSSVDPRWLLYALRSHVAQEQFLRKEVGTAVTGVNIGDLRRTLLPVPPRLAQETIAARLDARFGEMGQIKEAVATQITLLLERRQALITAAVTGQLEIPGAAA